MNDSEETVTMTLALYDRAEQARSCELQRVFGKVNLSFEKERAVDRMSRSIVQALLLHSQTFVRIAETEFERAVAGGGSADARPGQPVGTRGKLLEEGSRAIVMLHGGDCDSDDILAMVINVDEVTATNTLQEARASKGGEA
jgi:hypothetical protein